MRSTRDIRTKIRTVRSIEQICRAMKTVSSIRLRRAEQRLGYARPYHEKLMELVGHVASMTHRHIFLQERPVEKTCMVVVTSDRGLCGGYNAVVVRRALAASPPESTVAIALGRRGYIHLRREGYEIIDDIVPLGAEPTVASIYALAERIEKRYVEGQFDRVMVVYTRFLGGTRTAVTVENVLPIEPRPLEASDLIFEPMPEEMLPGLMRRYLQNELLSVVLESAAGEHAARVAAMTAATDNADEMIGSLTLEYNKARQAGITSELIEIVSAADSTG